MFVQKVSAEILCGGLKHICQNRSGLNKCILSVLAADVLNHFGCHEMLKCVLNLVAYIPWFWRKALVKIHTHLIATTAMWSARMMRGSCAALRLLFISNLHTCILPAACRKCVCVCVKVCLISWIWGITKCWVALLPGAPLSFHSLLIITDKVGECGQPLETLWNCRL